MTARAAALLVEDDEAFGQSLVDAIEERGLGLDWASTWDDGLELFRVNAYELVISDYNLRETDHGLRLLVRMKQLIPSSTLVLISGALTPGAERMVPDVDILEAYLSKSDGGTIAALAELIEQAEQRARQPTDWRAFAAGHLADLERDYPQVDRIDELLRREVDRE